MGTGNQPWTASGVCAAQREVDRRLAAGKREAPRCRKASVSNDMLSLILALQPVRFRKLELSEVVALKV